MNILLKIPRKIEIRRGIAEKEIIESIANLAILKKENFVFQISVWLDEM